MSPSTPMQKAMTNSFCTLPCNFLSQHKVVARQLKGDILDPGIYSVIVISSGIINTLSPTYIDAHTPTYPHMMTVHRHAHYKMSSFIFNLRFRTRPERCMKRQSSSICRERNENPKIELSASVHVAVSSRTG